MKDKKYIRWIVRLLYPYLNAILLIFILLILSTIFSAIMPLLIKEIMDSGIIGENYKVLILLVVSLIVSNLIINILGVIQEKQRIKIQTQMEKNLREDSISHIFKLKMHYLRNVNNVELMNNLETDITNIVSILDENMMFVITKIFMIMGGIIGLVIINWKLSIIVCMCLPVKYLGMKILSDKKEKITERYICKILEYNKLFGNILSGIREVKLFNIAKIKQKELNEKIDDMLIEKKKFNIINQYNQSYDSLLIEIIIAFIYLISGLIHNDFKLTIGGITAFVTYSTYVISPISSLLNIKYYLSGIMPSVKRFNEFINLTEERETGKDFLKQKNITISFRDVSFYYEADTPVLNHLSFDIGSGDRVFVIGACPAKLGHTSRCKSDCGNHQ